MIARRLAGGLTLLFLLAGCDALTSVDQRLGRAETALNNGDFGTASIELRKAADAEPDNAQVRVLLARLALRASDGNAAVAELERARAAGAEPAVVDPLLLDAWLQAGRGDDVVAYFARPESPLGQPVKGIALGRAKLLAGKPDEALLEFDAALAQDAKSRRARAGRTEALAALGRTDEALREIGPAVAADPGFWQGALVQSRLLGQQRDFAAAEPLLQRALDTMGSESTLDERARALVLRVDAAMSLGKLDVAATHQAELQKMLPESPLSQLTGARLELARGKFGEGAAQLQRLLARAPNLTYARLLLGAALLSEGNLQQAQQQLQQVVDAEPANAEGAKLLAQVRLRLDDADGAVEALVPALSGGALDAQALALMGQAQASAADDPKVLAALQRAQAAAPDNGNLRLALAQALVAGNRPGEALPLLGPAAVVGDSGRYFALRLAAVLGARGPAAAQADARALQAAQPQDAGLANAAASLYASTGDFDKARAALKLALDKNGAALPVLNALAGLEAATGRNLEARDLLQRSLQSDPSSVPVRVALASVQSRLGASDDALKTLQAPTPGAADPSGQLPFATARIELGRGRLKEAEAALDAAIAAQPGAERVAQAGRLLFEARQWEPALVRFKRAVELAPNVAAFHAEVARTELALDRTAEAQTAAMQALKLEASNPTATLVLVTLDVRAGKPDEALKRLDALEKSRAGDPQVAVLRGDVLMAAKRPAEAAKAYRAASDQRPDGLLAIKEYQALQAAGDSTALKPLEAWLALRPRDNRVRAALAEHHLKRADNKRAVAEYERMLETQPQNAVVLNNLAWAYQQARDPRALKTAEKAWQLASGNAAVADTYGGILLEQGNVAQALPLLQAAARSLTDSGDVQLRYATALMKSGRHAESVEILNGVVASRASSPDVRAAAEKMMSDSKGAP